MNEHNFLLRGVLYISLGRVADMVTHYSPQYISTYIVAPSNLQPFISYMINFVAE